MKKHFQLLIAALLCMPCVIMAQVPTNGLVLYLPLNNNAQDQSSTGAVSSIASGSIMTGGLTCAGNSYYQLNSGQGVQFSTTVYPSLQPSNITFSAWVYLVGGPSTYPTIIEISDRAYLRFFNGNLQAGVKNLSGYTTALTYAPQQGWNHLVYTYGPNINTLYVNGVDVVSSTGGGGNTNIDYSAPASGLDNLFVGGLNNTNRYFTGGIDEVRVYNRTVNAAEALSLYQDYDPRTPSVSFASAPNLFAPGESTILSPTVCGVSGGYSWSLNGASISGANAPTLSLNNLQASNSGTYTFTAGTACRASASVNITVSSQYSGLASYYPFENTSNVGQDMKGSATMGNSGQVSSVAGGVLSNAAQFTNGARLFGQGPRPGSLTLSAWVNYTGTLNQNSWVCGTRYNNVTSPYNSASIVVGTVNQNRATFNYTVGGTDQTIRSNTALVAGRWYHLAATYDEATGVANLYVDGVLEATNTTTPNGPLQYNSTTQNFEIGNMPRAGGCVFTGLIDEVYVYNRALSASEITTNSLSSFEEVAKAFPLSLYPNPSNGTFSIDGLEINETIIVSDLLGRTVHTQVSQSETETISVSGLDNGLYLVRAGKKLGKLLVSK